MPTPTRSSCRWRKSVAAAFRFALRHFGHHKSTTAILIALSQGVVIAPQINPYPIGARDRPSAACRRIGGDVDSWAARGSCRSGSHASR